MTPKKTLSHSIRRGFLGRCPRCGKGRLLHHYLKVVANCAICAEPFDHYAADDAPPYLTLFIVGHVVIPVMLSIDRAWDWSTGSLIGAGCVFATVLTGLLLPAIKGMVIGILWSIQGSKN